MSTPLRYTAEDTDELLGRENGCDYIRRGKTVFRIEGAYMREWGAARQWESSAVCRRIENRKRVAESDKQKIAAFAAGGRK